MDDERFQVDETLVMHSPFTNEDTLVNFRGFLGGDKAVVITPTGLQMSVPSEWLRKQ